MRNRLQYFVIAAIGAVTVTRLAYALFVVDPFSGPDSLTYHEDAKLLVRQGLLTDEGTLSYAPSGYPLFISVLYRLFGVEPRVVTVVQVLLFGVATYLVFRLSQREFGDAYGSVIGTIGVVLLSASPALVALPAELLYEAVLLPGMVVSVDIISRGLRPDAAHRGPLCVLGFFLLGVTSAANSEVLVPAALYLIWMVVRRFPVGVVAACAVALAVAPTGQAARNYVATGDIALSTNAGLNVMVGNNPAANGLAQSTYEDRYCETHEIDSLSVCGLRWALDNPSRSARLTVLKTWYFFGPLVGPLALDPQPDAPQIITRSTWFHGFDYARLLPDNITSSAWFHTMNVVMYTAWVALSIGLIAAGTWKGLINEDTRTPTTLVLIPLAGFLAVSIVTFGDPRHRLPVAPFYVLLQAIAMRSVVGKRARSQATVPDS